MISSVNIGTSAGRLNTGRIAGGNQKQSHGISNDSLILTKMETPVELVYLNPIINTEVPDKVFNILTCR